MNAEARACGNLIQAHLESIPVLEGARSLDFLDPGDKMCPKLAAGFQGVGQKGFSCGSGFLSQMNEDKTVCSEFKRTFFDQFHVFSRTNIVHFSIK